MVSSDVYGSKMGCPKKTIGKRLESAQCGGFLGFCLIQSPAGVPGSGEFCCEERRLRG